MPAAYEVVARPGHLPAHDQLGEVPVWDSLTDALWWVDIVGRRVQRYEPASGEVRAWAAPDLVSGAVPRKDGGLVVALREGLHRLNLGSGLFEPWITPERDARNRSNEFACDRWGRLWLGTMWNNIGPHGEDRPVEQSTGAVYCVESDGRCTRVLSDIGITNTFVWSPDGARMVTADTKAGVLWSFAADAERPVLSDRRVLVEPGVIPGHPDGSAMDEEGCLWNARWGAGRLARITPEGRVDRTLELPCEQPSSCAFGGADGRTLYVTSARQGIDAPGELDGALFAVPMDVAGPPTRRFPG